MEGDKGDFPAPVWSSSRRMMGEIGKLAASHRAMSGSPGSRFQVHPAITQYCRSPREPETIADEAPTRRDDGSWIVTSGCPVTQPTPIHPGNVIQLDLVGWNGIPLPGHPALPGSVHFAQRRELSRNAAPECHSTGKPGAGSSAGTGNPDGLCTLTTQLKQLGYTGMHLVHPSHVPVGGEVFTPTLMWNLR